MSNISIDAEVLNALAQSLSQAANLLNSALSSNNTPTKPEKRKGRPKKVEPSKQLLKDLNSLLPKDSTEIVSVEEEVLEILKEPTQPPQKKVSPHVIAAKSILNRGVDSIRASVEVRKKAGEIKFIDVENVPHEKENWEPSERRNPAKQMDFLCDRCGKKWQAYPSEYPQAFMKEKIPTGGEDRPRIYCDSCAGMGK